MLDNPVLQADVMQYSKLHNYKTLHMNTMSVI